MQSSSRFGFGSSSTTTSMSAAMSTRESLSSEASMGGIGQQGRSSNQSTSSKVLGMLFGAGGTQHHDGTHNPSSATSKGSVGYSLFGTTANKTSKQENAILTRYILCLFLF